MSRGRAYPITKRTSHITLIVDEIKPGNTVPGSARKEIQNANIKMENDTVKIKNKKRAKRDA